MANANSISKSNVSQIVLSEDEYETRLWEIIKREYFPDLGKIEEMNRILWSEDDVYQSILKSERSLKYSDIEKKLRSISNKSAVESSENALSQFLSRYTSEDN